jgi:hypothetical protein
MAAHNAETDGKMTSIPDDTFAAMHLQPAGTGYHMGKQQSSECIQLFDFSIWPELANNDLRKRAA